MPTDVAATLLMHPVAISRQNIRSVSRRNGGFPGDFIGDLPVNAFIQPAGLPITTSRITSARFTEPLMLEGLTGSIGSAGDTLTMPLPNADRALQDRVLRPSPFHAGRCKTIEDVEYATFEWLDWFNNRCLHSSLGMIPPTDYEPSHYSKNPRPIPEPAATYKMSLPNPRQDTYRFCSQRLACTNTAGRG